LEILLSNSLNDVFEWIEVYSVVFFTAISREFLDREFDIKNVFHDVVHRLGERDCFSVQVLNAKVLKKLLFIVSLICVFFSIRDKTELALFFSNRLNHAEAHCVVLLFLLEVWFKWRLLSLLMMMRRLCWRLICEGRKMRLFLLLRISLLLFLLMLLWLNDFG
jgi:hypothetical protein